MPLLVNLSSIKYVQVLSEETCQICGDEVEITVDEELFVACNECAFPVCRTCYEYERNEGSQACPQCKTRYKRIKGSPRVEGDEEEYETDDLEHEFDYGNPDAPGFKQKVGVVPSVPAGSTGSATASSSQEFEIPLLTYTTEDAEIHGEQQAIIISVKMDPDLPMILHPVHNAYGLWITSVICEIWFAVSWILDQFPKWCPVERETYLDRLSLRYERDFEGGKSSELASVDIFVSTVDPMKEPPLITANTVLSILAVYYPVDKVSCYVSDDGAAMLTFEREYDDFKVQINRLVAMAEKVPEDGWTMQDGTPWPGNNVRDHPGMIQVLLGHDGLRDVEGNELPRLVYVSREKRPGFEHHKKAGAMNALVRVSAVLSNAPYLLNVDCDHYINNSKTLREAVCFMMDPTSGKKVGYVQFPQRFDGMDRHDRYSNRNVVFFDINMKGLDGLQGPMYVGTGKKIGGKSKKDKKKKTKQRDASKQIHALETIEQRIKEPNIASMPPISQETLEKKFGQPPVFVASTLSEDGGVLEGVSSTSLLKEAIHVISCGYEDKTEWERRLDGFMALSQKIYSQGSRCTAVAGAQFTASLRGQHSRDQLPLTSLIVSTRFCDGLLGQSRFS
ncbi:hypothetical protein SASPL_151920 [Salvia splendens]|uniref:Cellulose synthase n=1 Tax=Salvia splendens TaxID=180675 RepID=A0A8X8Z0U8_SALSN|nr:hypothetical protein SASPL_151920 [Salvia splendens]